MHATRKIAFAPRCHALAEVLASMPSPCLGCDNCQGICQTLIDTLLLPDLILKGRAP